MALTIGYSHTGIDKYTHIFSLSENTEQRNVPLGKKYMSDL